MNIAYPPTTIYDVLKKGLSLKQAVYRYDKNLDVIPATIKIESEDRKPVVFQERIRKLANYYDVLLSDVVDNYDLILLDSAPGFGIEALTTMRVADGILIITNPEVPALSAAVKAMEYAKLLKVPMAGIALNKVRGASYEPKIPEIEQALGARISGIIPMDEHVPESIALKLPVVMYKPHCRASIAIKKLAASIIGRRYKEESIFTKTIHSIKTIFGIKESDVIGLQKHEIKP